MHESTCFHKRFNRFLCYNAQYTGAVCKSAPSHVTLTDFSCSCDVSRQLGSNFDQTERQIFKAILFRKSLSEVEFLGNHWSQGPSTNNLAPHSRAPEHFCQFCELQLTISIQWETVRLITVEDVDAEACFVYLCQRSVVWTILRAIFATWKEQKKV